MNIYQHIKTTSNLHPPNTPTHTDDSAQQQQQQGSGVEATKIDVNGCSSSGEASDGYGSDPSRHSCLPPGKGNRKSSSTLSKHQFATDRTQRSVGTNSWCDRSPYSPIDPVMECHCDGFKPMGVCSRDPNEARPQVTNAFNQTRIPMVPIAEQTRIPVQSNKHRRIHLIQSVPNKLYSPLAADVNEYSELLPCTHGHHCLRLRDQSRHLSTTTYSLDDLQNQPINQQQNLKRNDSTVPRFTLQPENEFEEEAEDNVFNVSLRSPRDPMGSIVPTICLEHASETASECSVLDNDLPSNLVSSLSHEANRAFATKQEGTNALMVPRRNTTSKSTQSPMWCRYNRVPNTGGTLTYESPTALSSMTGRRQTLAGFDDFLLKEYNRLRDKVAFLEQSTKHMTSTANRFKSRPTEKRLESNNIPLTEQHKRNSDLGREGFGKHQPPQTLKRSMSLGTSTRRE